MSDPNYDRSITSVRWRDVRDGLSGRARDYTVGPLWPAVIALAVPMMLEMVMQSVFEVADIWFVGRLGPDAVAAVGLSSALVILVFAVAIGLSLGAQAMVSRRIGEGDREAAADAALQACLTGISVSVVVGIVGVLQAEPLLRLMGATEAVVREGRTYFSILVGGNVTIVLLFLLNAVFRGAGDASLAMRALWIANLLNVLLDPLFIFGLGPIPALGVTGAAIATTMGRGLGVAFQLWALSRGRTRLKRPEHGLRLDPRLVMRLFRVAGPGMIQFLVGTASFVAVMRIIAAFGSDALAGYTIAVRVIIFAALPAWGIGNAASTLVGQNLGAGSPDRAEQSVRMTAKLATALLTVSSVLMLVAAEPVMRLFTDAPGAVAVGANCLMIVAVAFPFRGTSLAFVQAFNGAGDTTTPTWINLGVYWLLQIPLIVALAHGLDLGPSGVFIGIAAAHVVAAFVSWRLFRQGRWRERMV